MTAAALTIPGLETAYELLATAIDEVGPDRSELLLVKLALLHANALGDPELFRTHLASAAAAL